MTNETNANTIRNLLIDALKQGNIKVTQIATDATDDEYLTLTYDGTTFARHAKTNAYQVEHTYNLEIKTKAKSLNLNTLNDKTTQLIVQSLVAVQAAEVTIKSQVKNLNELTPVAVQTATDDGESAIAVSVLQVKAVLFGPNLPTLF